MAGKKIEREKIKDLTKDKNSKKKPEDEITEDELNKVAGGMPPPPLPPIVRDRS